MSMPEGGLTLSNVSIAFLFINIDDPKQNCKFRKKYLNKFKSKKGVF